MKPVTREWVAKAEADFQSAAREARRRKQPNLDVVCFLAQQCIEKYLKARLQEESLPFGKTHDLEALAQQASTYEPALRLMIPSSKSISAYAVVFRYPGRSATKLEAKDAIQHAKEVRVLIRTALGLPCAPAAPRKRRTGTARPIRRRRRGS